jgi:hypothetical protein
MFLFCPAMNVRNAITGAGHKKEEIAKEYNMLGIK